MPKPTVTMEFTPEEVLYLRAVTNITRQEASNLIARSDRTDTKAACGVSNDAMWVRFASVANRIQERVTTTLVFGEED